MARPLRIEYEGAVYHVTSRGNAREDVYQDDKDRSRFLKILGDVVARFNWICHAYCLMQNHYHLLIETPEADLSRGMHLLNGVYTQWFNREHRRVGHLYQGRFKATLVEKENYLLELARYIVLNPVRAGIVKQASDWPWSSYGATAGLNTRSEWLNTDWLLSQFGSSRKGASTAYRRFVQQGIGIDVQGAMKGGWILGSDEFVNSIRPLLDDKPLDPEFRSHERHVARPNLEEIFAGVSDKSQRNVRIYEAVRTHRYTLREVGEHIGLRYSTISVIAKEVRDRRESA
jgi:putative transposase